MKTNLCLLLMAVWMMAAGCSKEDKNEPGNTATSLEAIAEADLTLKDGSHIYRDAWGNEYYNVLFDADHLSHVFKITLEQGKNYRMTIVSQCAYSIDLLLLRSESDTMFHGIDFMELPPKRVMYWKPNSTGTYYISTSYISDINFSTCTGRLVVEEITTNMLQYGDLSFECSGDWLLTQSGELAVALHNNGAQVWAKLMHNSYNYRFGYDLTQASGRPDNYIGIDCYASAEIFEPENMPMSGYVFDVVGPGEWRISYWHPQGGVGFEYGFLPQNLPLGRENWHNIGVETFSDSIAFSVNGDVMECIRNHSMLDNGLYILADDNKIDTLFFKNIVFEPTR